MVFGCRIGKKENKTTKKTFEVKERLGYTAKEYRKRHLLLQGEEKLLNRLEEPISKMTIRHLHFKILLFGKIWE